MHLDSLKFLVAVAQCGSTRKAAEQLNTSSQNISRVLKQLESEWDVTLFERTTQGMSPTADGQLALNFAQNMLKQHDDLLTAFHPAETNNDSLIGKITLFGSTLSSSCFLNKLLMQFMMQYPNIQVTLKENDIFALPCDDFFDSSRLCFMPRFKNTACSSSMPIEVIPLLTDQGVMLVNTSSSLAKQNSVSLKIAVQQPMVILSKNDFKNSGIYHLIEPYKDQMKTPFITSNHRYYSYIAQGNFVALSTQIGYDNTCSPTDKTQIAAVPIRDEEASFEHCLFIYNPQQLSTVEQCFVAFVKNYFNQPI